MCPFHQKVMIYDHRKTQIYFLELILKFEVYAGINYE